MNSRRSYLVVRPSASTRRWNAEEETRDASARRRFNIFVALASIGAACACVGLTTDMIGHTAKFRAAMQSPRLGAGRWTSSTASAVDAERAAGGGGHPALAFAEMDRVKLEGSALEAAKVVARGLFSDVSRVSVLGRGRARARKLETPVSSSR